MGTHCIRRERAGLVGQVQRIHLARLRSLPLLGDRGGTKKQLLTQSNPGVPIVNYVEESMLSVDIAQHRMLTLPQTIDGEPLPASTQHVLSQQRSLKECYSGMQCRHG